MEEQTSRARIWAAAGFLVLAGAAAACSNASNLVGPSGQSSATPTATVAAPSQSTSLEPGAPANLSPADLIKRGWTCLQPPVPDGRTACSHPNQGFPSIPAPADRPASFTFFIFDRNGSYVGTELLLRTDIYNGQLCESTGEKYVFRPPIGYYECIHTTGN